MKIKRLILVLVTLAMAGNSLLATPVTPSNPSNQILQESTQETTKEANNAVKETTEKTVKEEGAGKVGIKDLPEGSKVITRITRNGEKGVQIKFPDGTIKDITPSRVKEYIPQTNPKAPSGTMQKVKFKNALPRSKGYKRAPTPEELNLLKELTK